MGAVLHIVQFSDFPQSLLCLSGYIPDFDHEILGWDPNEKTNHAYTSATLNITVFDESLPIIFELFHKVIFKIFRAVFP